jgi:DNA-binding transcriptional LysR family regulator
VSDALSFRALRAFVAVAEELHFGRAAERLGVAQPGLSQQVQRMERLLGTALFLRQGRHVTLTAAGTALLQHARPLLAQGERLAAHVARAARGEVGTLRVGFAATAAYDILPGIARRLRQRAPGIQLEVDGSPPGLAQEMVAAGGLDALVARGPVREAGLQAVTLDREPLCAVVSRNHPRARQRTITAGALAGEPFALFPRHTAPALYDAITGMCRDAGFVAHVAHEATDWPAVASLVAAGLGVTLAPESVRLLPHPGLAYLRLRGAPPVAQLDVVTAPAPGPLARAFVEAARAAAADRRRTLRAC